MDTKNYTVLVIEDEQLLLEAIARKLKFNGLSVIPVARGDEALKILSESEKLPDVIWLDYYLSDMNGLEFMNNIRKNNMLALGVKKYYLKAENRLDEIIKFVKEFVEKQRNEKS